MKTEELLDALTHILKRHMADQIVDPMVVYKDSRELETLLHLDKKDANGDWSAIFAWIEKYLHYSVKTNHPGFVNRMWVGANLPSIFGEMATAMSNTSSCTYESAPVSTLMEKYMIGEMLKLVGFQNGEGQMTTGSSNANMLAMMAARNEFAPQCKKSGLYAQGNLHCYVSTDAHYSMEKAANILGLGTDNLIKVPVNDLGEMDIRQLEMKIQESHSQGALPFFVGGTAGTTVRGAYDSIEKLLELKKEYSFWLHIDGAWGGAVLVSDTLREKYLKGIGDIDSLTWDFHKMLGTSLMCNVFLINKRTHTLGKVCSAGDDSYIFHNEGNNEVHDLGAVSLQCGRRVDSLKWFLDWKFYGKEEFGRRVEYSYELCRYAEEIVAGSDNLEMVFPRTSFNICFRYKTNKKEPNQLNLAIRETLHKKGKSLVGYAYHEGVLFLRLLLANNDLTREDIEHYFMTIIETGKSLEEMT